jgi:glycosyltransferase involved in cell wall biosynthesis
MNTDSRPSVTAAGPRPFRILHVSPTDTEGGAAMGAYGIHTALRNAGVDSLMLVQRKFSADPTVITQGLGAQVLVEALRGRVDRLPLRFQRRQPDNWWTVGVMPIRIAAAVRRLAPDLVQFHWAGRGAAPIETLRAISHLPIIWTLRDMWPLTGGCHYSGGCQRFLTGCGNCPQLGSERARDLSAWQWRRKQRSWRNVNITFVALSRWMANYARQSPLVFNNTVSIIPNGIDTQTFSPMDKTIARARWGLPQKRPIVMFGALFGTEDPRKGFAYLRDALRSLAGRPEGKGMLAVIFGAEDSAEDLGVETRYVGIVRGRTQLAELYGCADVMVVPSTEENFGKTALEAMACGVPTVAFANTGQLDIIDHRINGYLAEDRSSDDLARGILWCLDQERRTDSLSRNARDKAARKFDIGVIAQEYVALYARLLEGLRAAPSDVRNEAFHDTVSAAAIVHGPLVAPVTHGHGGGTA